MDHSDLRHLSHGLGRAIGRVSLYFSLHEDFCQKPQIQITPILPKLVLSLKIDRIKLANHFFNMNSLLKHQYKQSKVFNKD